MDRSGPCEGHRAEGRELGWWDLRKTPLDSFCCVDWRVATRAGEEGPLRQVRQSYSGELSAGRCVVCPRNGEAGASGEMEEVRAQPRRHASRRGRHQR